jgi:hypothetical protein
LECRNCGGPVELERVDLGYDYCLNQECQERCLKPVRLAAVGVNKAADYYMRADEVLPPPGPPPSAPADGDTGDSRPHRLPGAAPARRAKSTLERLQEQEAELDTALERSYQRFCRGEVTAAEMDRERDQLIRAFNQRVMGENIRYRSMLRGRSGSRGQAALR